jgi:hypothetical protein
VNSTEPSSRGGEVESRSLPFIGEAAFWFLLEHEFEIVYWNQNQKEFDRYSPYVEFAGCKWRSYDWSERPSFEPNFECLEVKFWWYKYPGRSMMTNVDYDGNQWADWLKRALDDVGRYDYDL